LQRESRQTTQEMKANPDEGPNTSTVPRSTMDSFIKCTSPLWSHSYDRISCELIECMLIG